jgi:competence protein ComEC
MNSRSLGHRAPVLWLVLPLMGGLATGRVSESIAAPWLLTGAVFAAITAVILAYREVRLFAPAVCLAMFLAGMASYALHRPRIAAWDLLPPREARLALRIDRVFAQDDPQKTAGLATVMRAEQPSEDLMGQRVYFSLTLLRGERAPLRSSVVTTLGVIASLARDPPVNTFDGYLANAGINFRFTRGLVLSEERQPSAYYRFCAKQAERFTTILGVGVQHKRPELVGVLHAMLLGQQHELSDEHVAIFRQSGTMHVFSISGLHIAVIAVGLHTLLSLIRLPAWIRYVIELVALWLYVDITGAAPSAVRAFVMVAVVETALVFRLPRNPLSALATSALLILIFSPLQLFSASFQMSYGIVAALLLLGLPLADSWQNRLALFEALPKAAWGWHRHALDALWRGVLAATAIGTAASLVSAVTGVLFFELFTPGALLANLWLIPACSAVLYMGMLSLLAGLVGFAAGSALANHAAVLLLWIIEAGIRLSVEMPATWFNATFKYPWLGAATLGALLAALVAGYITSWRGWNRGYWAPFAVVSLALVLGVTFT